MRAIDADAMIDRLKEWNTKDKTDKALYNFTLNRINEQPTIQPAQPHWIPVTERLPDELEPVIMTVYRTDKSYNQRPYIRIGFRRSEMWYPIPQESAPFGRDLSSYDGGNPVVTAWMPLSEPYQKGEQDDR